MRHYPGNAFQQSGYRLVRQPVGMEAVDRANGQVFAQTVAADDRRVTGAC